MESLIAYINGLDQAGRERFERMAGTSIGYLRKARSVGQVLGPQLCVDIEDATGGAFMRWHLRPSDWHRLWPELRMRADAPAIGRAVAEVARA